MEKHKHKMAPFSDQEKAKLDEITTLFNGELTICLSCGALVLKSRAEAMKIEEGTKEEDTMYCCVNCCNVAMMIQRLTIMAGLLGKMAEKKESKIVIPT